MHPFFKIMNASYSETEISALMWWSDELMKELDIYVASGLEWNKDNENHSIQVQVPQKNIFDWEDLEWES